MKASKWLAGLGVVLLAAASCARGGLPGFDLAPRPQALPVEVVERSMMEEAAPGLPAAEPAPGEPGGSLNAFDRMVIRQAHLSLGVESTQQTMASVRSLVAASGGLVTNVSTWREGDNLYANLTVRIPAGSFDQVMEQIKQVAKEVRGESVSSQDVTEEFIDLSARKRNLEATEIELLALLTEARQNLRSVDQVLLIHRELMRIREEIERIEGRRQFLQNASDLATLTIELIPLAATGRPQPGWQPAETLRAALGRLADTVQELGDAAIWLLAYVLPLVALLLGPVALLAYALKRLASRPAV